MCPQSLFRSSLYTFRYLSSPRIKYQINRTLTHSISLPTITNSLKHHAQKHPSNTTSSTSPLLPAHLHLPPPLPLLNTLNKRLYRLRTRTRNPTSQINMPIHMTEQPCWLVDLPFEHSDAAAAGDGGVDAFVCWCGGDEGFAFLEQAGLEGGVDLGGEVNWCVRGG